MSEQSVRCEGTVSAECHMENHKATHKEHGVLGKSVSRKEEMRDEQSNSFQCQKLSSAGCANVSNGRNRWVRM